MKFWAILQIPVDGFWGGRCGVFGEGGAVVFLLFEGPHVQKLNLFLPTYVNVFQNCYTSSILKLFKLM